METATAASVSYSRCYLVRNAVPSGIPTVSARLGFAQRACLFDTGDYTDAIMNRFHLSCHAL